MKNKPRIWIAVLAAVLLSAAFLHADIRQVLGKWLMLFTQNSTQSLQGYIMRSAHPFLSTVFLSFFQMAVLPWFVPRICVAGAIFLGDAAGLAAVISGAMLAWGFWFALFRLLFPNGIRKLHEVMPGAPGWIALGAAMAVPWALPLVAGILALSRSSAFRCSLGMLTAVSLRTFLYIHFCSLYTSYLPDSVNYSVRIAGMGILLLVFLRNCIKAAPKA